MDNDGGYPAPVAASLAPEDRLDTKMGRYMGGRGGFYAVARCERTRHTFVFYADYPGRGWCAADVYHGRRMVDAKTLTLWR
jgi:hypothetical protein